MTLLPRFDAPPVIEVALSVMFETPKGLKIAHFGMFWNRIRSDFPQVNEQPALDLPRELAREPRHRGEATLRFEPMTTPPLRLWFLNKEGTELLQLQHDRFARNWRRAGTTSPYPSYDNIRAPFERDLRGFETFIREEGLGSLTPVQCEVTYVNHIAAGNLWMSHGQADRVFSNWKLAASGSFLPEPEDVNFNARYPIVVAGEFAGRLHVSVQPAYSGEDPLFVSTLTARGNPLGPGLDGALRFLDLGHEWIVQGFTDSTTPAMHQQWSRQR